MKAIYSVNLRLLFPGRSVPRDQHEDLAICPFFGFNPRAENTQLGVAIAAHVQVTLSS